MSEEIKTEVEKEIVEVKTEPNKETEEIKTEIKKESEGAKVVNKVNEIGLVILIVIGLIVGGKYLVSGIYNKVSNIFVDSGITKVQNIKPYDNYQNLKERIKSESTSEPKWTSKTSKEAFFGGTVNIDNVECKAPMKLTNNQTGTLNMTYHLNKDSDDMVADTSFCITINGNDSYMDEKEFLQFLYGVDTKNMVTDENVHRLLG